MSGQKNLNRLPCFLSQMLKPITVYPAPIHADNMDSKYNEAVRKLYANNNNISMETNAIDIDVMSKHP
jgi:hypothetical protein